jgi:hypothetical protein
LLKKLSLAVREEAEGRQLLSAEHFTVDGTLLDAWASLKSVRRGTRMSGFSTSPFSCPSPGPAEDALVQVVRASCGWLKDRGDPLAQRLWRSGRQVDQ